MGSNLPVADHWFERTRIDDAITLLIEPHVPLLDEIEGAPSAAPRRHRPRWARPEHVRDPVP